MTHRSIIVPLVGSKTGSRMTWHKTGSRNSSGTSPKDASASSYDALASNTALKTQNKTTPYSTRHKKKVRKGGGGEGGGGRFTCVVSGVHNVASRPVPVMLSQRSTLVTRMENKVEVNK